MIVCKVSSDISKSGHECLESGRECPRADVPRAESARVMSCRIESKEVCQTESGDICFYVDKWS